MRPPTPVLYGPDDVFRVGGSHLVAGGADDRVTIVAHGIAVHEALAARDRLAHDGIGVRVIDAYSVKPLDVDTILAAAAQSEVVLTVEDHRPEGGLAEAVASVLAGMPLVFRALAVRGIPRSGTRDELLDAEGISARSIVDAVREGIQARPARR